MQRPDVQQNPFYIDTALVQPQRNRILKDGEVIKLQPRVMEVLLFFAAHPGKVLSRDTLLDAVWEDAYVEAIALTRAVSEIRKVFDDDPHQPRIIETIHKRGYRLIADVRPANDEVSGKSGKMNRFRAGNGSRSSATSRTVFISGAVVGFLLLAGMLIFFSFTGFPTSGNVTVQPGTSLNGNEIDPSLSPDGSQLAFTWMRPDDDGSDLYVKSIGAGVDSKLQLTDTPYDERNPTWSPRGNQIAFVRYDGESSYIYVISSLGGTERMVTQVEGVRYPKLAWSPDGTRLAYSVLKEGNSSKQLYLVNVSTGDKERVTLPASRSYGDFHPAFSPDGNKIAFVRGEAKGIHDIFVLDRETRSFDRVTSDFKRIGGITFSSDGSEIIFSSDRGGTFSLWSVSVNGGEPRWLGYTGERVFDPILSQNGTAMAYEKWHSNMDIWEFVPGESTNALRPMETLSSSRGELAPEYSPGGTGLVFVTSRSGSPQIWMSDAGGGNARMLLDLHAPVLGPVKWSPDGRSIVYNSREGGNADIYTYSLETGDKTRITTHEANDISPNFSRDGRSVYFGSDRDGGWQLYRKDLGDKTVESVTEDGGFFAIESVNGRDLYVSNADRDGIWKVGPDGSLKLIIPDLEPHQWYNWAVTSSGLYYVGRTSQGKPAIKKYLEGETTVLTALPDWPETPGFTVSADGKRMLMTFESEGESDIMIARFDGSQ